MAGDQGQVAHLGIPEAEFVEDVEKYMKRSGDESIEAALKKLDEMHNKYRFMEVNLQNKKSKLKTQIPDIKSTLAIVRQLKKKQEADEVTEARFMLSDQVYSKAKIPPTDKVCLWLGANVMLEYPVADAERLLEKNLAAAERNLAQLEEDLGFLRDQTTTMEVNMARVYNWDVKRREGGPAVKSS